MDTFFNILKKSLVLGMTFVFAFIFTYVPQRWDHTPSAHAFVGGGDLDTDFPSFQPIIFNTGVSATADTIDQTKEQAGDPIAYGIAKALLSQITADIVSWINSGFEGKPAFVQDLRRTLLEVADREAGRFIQSLGEFGSYICSPYQLDIQRTLTIEYQRIRENRPLESCTLTGVINNIEDFYEGISEGGLEDWITITQNPDTYSSYGQLLTARNNMRMQLAAEQNRELTEINWGSGFLSGKICEAFQGPSGPGETCVISKPGEVIADTLNKTFGAGQDQLIAADEINEIIGALISQLANKAITGSAGLLGLSSGTGYTYSGFAGGSFVNAAVGQSNDVVSTTANNSGISPTVFTDAITFHNNLVPFANGYVVQLTNYANDTRNPADKRATALVLAQSAVTVRDKALELIPEITAISTEYQTLETEKNTPGTSITRQQEIVQEQAALYSQYLNLRPYDQDQIDLMKANWDTVFIQ